MKKIWGFLLLPVCIHLGLFFLAHTSFGAKVLQAALITASGTAAAVNTLNVTLVNGTSLSGTTSGTTFNFAARLKVDYFSNQEGYQAILIYTDNSNAAANPRYTGGGDGAGLVLSTATAVNVPMHWVVHTTSFSYNFHPIDPSNEFFVVDQRRPDGSAFPAGFASFLYDLNRSFGYLAAAPIANRSTNSGTVYINLAANFAGASAGTYKTNQLKIALCTLNNGQIVSVEQIRIFSANVVCT
ncbi:MAG: hypothetical protein HY714_05310 [Candidatus Omnitrophica bacterium]|nr:hypothetical protein [Candidatus Omnitrophota bacterium]